MTVKEITTSSLSAKKGKYDNSVTGKTIFLVVKSLNRNKAQKTRFMRRETSGE
jgi:hypothetical protein